MIPARTALVHGQGAGRGGARRYASGAVYFLKSVLKQPPSKWQFVFYLYVRPKTYNK